MQDESLNLLFLGGGLSSFGKGIAGGITSLFTKSAAEDAVVEAAAQDASAGTSSGIIASGSKAAIRHAIESGTIGDAQAQAVKRALAR